MPRISRREFAAAATALSAGPLPAKIKISIDETLKGGIERRKIPCVTAMVADSHRVLYRGAFGTRDAASGTPVKIDSIFSIASMTKAITSFAAVQLVEAKKVSLDEPAEKYLAELSGRQVLDGFAADGHAKLRAPSKPVTLRNLLTHTSGLCYDLWEPEMVKWRASPGVTPATPAPLMFEPGSRWQYGQGIDLAGRLIETISGLSLEDYFQKHILVPLRMEDTSFLVPPAKFERLVTSYRRQPDGVLTQNERRQPSAPAAYNGGGGLFSTAPDYIRFAQAILQNGAGLVKRDTFKLLATNQIGKLRAGFMKSTTPGVSSDVDIHPGEVDHHTLGFVINPKPHTAGRAAGSLAWAGINNTFYWIDTARNRCAVIMMQFQPFVDREAVGLLEEFERAVYSA